MMGMLVGHLVGDYLLQNDWMALNKKFKNFEGRLACGVHCFLWTLSVLAFFFGLAVPGQLRIDGLAGGATLCVALRAGSYGRYSLVDAAGWSK